MHLVETELGWLDKIISKVIDDENNQYLQLYYGRYLFVM